MPAQFAFAKGHDVIEWPMKKILSFPIDVL